MFAEWLRSNYLGLIAEIVREVDGQAWEVTFVSAQTPKTGAAGAAVPALPTRLDPRYTFETFVVGKGNEFAHAAALSIAEQRSSHHNPLYIYGGTGLGKTHLLHAIGNHVAKSGRMLRLKYISAEEFVNEMINSLRNDTNFEFRDKYRSIELLLIDDVQFLAGKERTQEEFFHTFNALYEARRHIVLTSDCQPREIRAPPQERLVSRLQWGLMAHIQP